MFVSDETSIPVVPRPSRVAAQKGQKEVRYCTSGTKALITNIGCGSVTGQALPPLIIFAAKQLNCCYWVDIARILNPIP